jgi:hypothetical protein
MPFNFTPLNDDELESIGLVPDGIYDFVVTKSTRKVSKAGNDMAELVLDYWDHQGRVHPIYDYLVFSEAPLSIRKLCHFCRAVGWEHHYKAGSLPDDFGGLSGKIEISTQEARQNPNGGTYPKKNVVVDYHAKSPVDATTNIGSEQGMEDDIPF